MRYEVHLNLARGIFPVEADKFCMDEPEYVVFYARPQPGYPFEEVARFSTNNVAKIEEIK
jgi:hypothetical protein